MTNLDRLKKSDLLILGKLGIWTEQNVFTKGNVKGSEKAPTLI